MDQALRPVLSARARTVLVARALWLVLAIALSACAADAPLRGVEAVASEADAASCGATDLVSARCTGAFRYREWASCAAGEGARVSLSTCAAPPICRTRQTCTDWSFGAGAVETRAHVFERSIKCGDNPKAERCMCKCTEQESEAAPLIAQLRSEIPQAFHDRVRIRGCSVQESWVIKVHEPWIGSDEYTVGSKCRVEVELPRPASGSSPVCACRGWECRAPGCGAAPEERRSPPGLTLDELGRQTPLLADLPAPVCTTCDPLPLDTPAAARAKHACLAASAATDPAQRARTAARFRVLLMLEADALTSAARDLAWEAFAPAARGGALACEPGFQLALPAACPASDRDALARDLAGCERIASGLGRGVRPSVAWVLADRCVGLLERLDDVTDPAAPAHACASRELSERVRGSAARVVRGALDALEERGALGTAVAAADARYPELERTLALLSRWYAAERAVVEGGAESSLAEMVATFWSTAQRIRRVTTDLEESLARGTPSASEVGALLAASSARADRLDRDVILAAYRGPGATLEAVVRDGVEILPAAALEGPVVRGALLVTLTGQALTGLSRALERTEPFHDLGCRFGGCGPHALTRALENTRLGSLWSALGALDRPSDGEDESLPAALARISDDEPWRAPLHALADGHASLRDALDELVGRRNRPPLERLETDELPALARPLAALVRGASERAREYRASGLLRLPGGRRMHANVSSAGRAATLAAFDAARRAFASDVARFQAERRAAAGDALQQASGARALDAARARLRELDRELALLNADAIGLGATLLELDQGLGATADRIADLRDALDAGAFLGTGDTRRFFVRGHHAPATVDAAPNGQPIGLLAARDVEPGQPGTARIPVDANQLVTVQALGEYAPLCALHRKDGGRGTPQALEGALDARARGGPSGLSLSPLPGTTVGPEGFELVRDAQRAVTRSRQKDKGGLLGGVLGAVGSVLSAIAPPVGAAVGAVGQLVSGSGSRKVSASSESDAVRFQGGLRLDDTPFPELPAGALLLVELPRGATLTTTVRAIHLVQRGTTSFVVGADADLYLVVNDRWVEADCRALSPPDDPHAVSVLLRLATPSTSIAERSIEALRATLDGLRAERSRILRQGRILPSQLAQIAADAEVALDARIGIDRSELPTALADLLRAYVTREVAAVEVAVTRKALERRADDILLEADAVLRSIASLEGTQQAGSLLPVWRLRSFAELDDGTDARSLVDAARALLARSAETVLPILELWHPRALREVRGQAELQRDVQTLANLSADVDPLTLVDEVERIAGKLASAYESDPIAHFADPLNQPIVALSFARPSGWGPRCSFCLDSTSGLPAASGDRAFAVWNAIEAALRRDEPVPETRCASDADCAALPGTYCPLGQGGETCRRAPTTVELALEVDDVYRAGGGQATLPCFLATPVVQQWALLFANQADDYAEELVKLSKTGRALLARALPSQRFVTESGVVHFEMTHLPSLASGISLLYASDEDAYATFQSFANERLLAGRNPVGLSAFSRLTVDFASLASMRHSYGNGIGETADRAVTELVLFLRLDAREFATSPPGRELAGIVSRCSAGPAL